MKKIFAMVLTLVMLLSSFGMVAQAKVGDVVGTALHTDIVVYINHFAIPSYAVNGQSVIVAEDLRNFGFDVTWDGYSRSLYINRNSNTNVNPMAVSKPYTSGTKYTNILATDITVYAGGRRVSSYAMNGYTMVPVEELTMLGEVHWVAGERALKMWVDGLFSNDAKQMIAYKYYTGSKAPDFGWVTNTVCFKWDDESDGDKLRHYWADESQMQQYINHIKSQGWYLDKTIKGTSGSNIYGYINKNLRTGIAVSSYDGVVQVQIATNTDYWN